MPDEDQDRSQPNLEPPKLFGRRRGPERTPDPEKLAEPEKLAAPETVARPEPEPETEPEPQPRPEPVAAVLPAEGGTPLFADEVEEAPAPVPTKVRRGRAARPPRQPKQPAAPRAAKAPRAPRVEVTAPRLPTLTGWVAAAVTGVAIGLLLVGMTAGALQGCEAVRGTATCGGSGVVILVVIMAALVALGGVLLRLFNVPDPGSTSFLAVGMVAVISLLFLLDVLLSWWMLLVIPAISVAMYLLAYWVTTAFVEPAKEPAER
jgi:hypothetical protein